MINTCPHCSRALLSHNSPRCNWCGQEITDAAYQQEAQAGREAFYQHEAERDAIELARVQSINMSAYDPLLNPLTNAPMFSPARTRIVPSNIRPQPKAPSPPPEQNDTSAELEDARFRHLEI